MKHSRYTAEDVLFALLTAGILLAVGGYLLIRNFRLERYAWGGSCLFLRLTGWYCPGCGGTRAFLALIKGDIAASLQYHPVVLYAIVFAAVFYLWQLVHYASKRRLPAFPYKNRYAYATFVLLGWNFLAKNAFHIGI